jgi:TRAP-type mannitol/chloroaromatic compound transport system permease large subunit
VLSGQRVAQTWVGTGDIYRGVIPFVILQLLALATVMAFPALATWLPGMLF